MFKRKVPKGVESSINDLRKSGRTDVESVFREIRDNDRHALTKEWTKKDKKNMRAFINSMFDD